MKGSMGLIILFLIFGLGAGRPEDIESAVTLNEFRCPKGSLVLIHDRISEVQRKCGPPTEAARREGKRTLGYVPGYVYETLEIEEWTYNWGPTSFLISLTFENGRLTRIESGEYGY
jgi:hypothetical protein